MLVADSTEAVAGADEAVVDEAAEAVERSAFPMDPTNPSRRSTPCIVRTRRNTLDQPYCYRCLQVRNFHLWRTRDRTSQISLCTDLC